MKCELLQTFWPSGKDYKILIHMSFNPAVPLLGIQSVEINHGTKDTCTKVFIGVLFVAGITLKTK